MNFIMNSNAIKAETQKALLIKLPGSELCFWHPKRFCHVFGKSNYGLSVWFGDASWQIKAERRGKSGDVLESLESSAGQVAKSYNITTEE